MFSRARTSDVSMPHRKYLLLAIRLPSDKVTLVYTSYDRNIYLYRCRERYSRLVTSLFFYPRVFILEIATIVVHKFSRNYVLFKYLSHSTKGRGVWEVGLGLSGLRIEWVFPFLPLKGVGLIFGIISLFTSRSSFFYCCSVIILSPFSTFGVVILPASGWVSSLLLPLSLLPSTLLLLLLLLRNSYSAQAPKKARSGAAGGCEKLNMLSPSGHKVP